MDCVPFAPVLLIQGLLFASGKAKLDAGIGRVAQWHVAAEDWKRFRAFDRERMGSPGLPLRSRTECGVRHW